MLNSGTYSALRADYTDAASNIFNNPFVTMADRWSPTSMKEVFRLAEWLYRHNGIFKTAIERMANIFFTEYEFEEKQDNEITEKIKKYITKKPYLKRQITDAGREYLLYGNCFITIHLPFKRMVKCSRCKEETLGKYANLGYDTDKGFYGDCIHCKSTDVKFTHKDMPERSIEKISILRISPKEINIIYNESTGRSSYIWDMKTKTKTKYINGRGTHLVYETPLNILRAAHENLELEFNDQQLMHIKATNLSGLNIEWGVSCALNCFSTIFYLAVLKKANEAIGLDFIVPLRIIFPQVNTSSQEPNVMNLRKDFMEHIQRIVIEHRKDPASWHTSPIPLGYQTLGGEHRALNVSQDIIVGNDELLLGMGYPPSLYKGDIQLQATPMALRMLENTYNLTDIYNCIIEFYSIKTFSYLDIPYMEVTLQRLKWADDIERRQIIMSLAAVDKISDISVLEMYGLSYTKEQQKKIQQMKIMNEKQKEIEKQQQAMQQSQQMEQSGQQGLGINNLRQQAQQTAQELLSYDETTRKSYLDDLLKTNPDLHDLTIAEMDRARSSMRSQGMQVIKNQYGYQ